MADTSVDEIRVQLLGGFELWRGDGVVALPAPAARVVAITALQSRARREAIVTDLWPDAPPGRGQAYLRSALWRLRILAPGVIVPEAGGFLSVPAQVSVDAAALLAWAKKMIRDSTATPAPDLEALGRELLPGWADYWLDDHRERLRMLVPEALEIMASALLEDNAVALALWYALEAHQIDPLRESAARVLARIYQAQGNHALASDVFDRYRCTLRSELGVDPSPAFSRLVHGSPAHPSPPNVSR
jgi:DNA-binding SARP family transcriptional activator